MVERHLAKVEIGVRFSVPALGTSNLSFVFDMKHAYHACIAPVVKRISQQSSELSLRVRIPPGAQKINFTCPLIKALMHKDFIKNVDNYVGNVYKGHN